MAFRISSGDFQLDDYHNQDDGLVIFTWIIWLIAVMILNIIFMNFIIAVISESYERVMQKLVAESFRVKANMIVEREQLFNEDDLKSINISQILLLSEDHQTQSLINWSRLLSLTIHLKNTNHFSPSILIFMGIQGARLFQFYHFIFGVKIAKKNDGSIEVEGVERKQFGMIMWKLKLVVEEVKYCSRGMRAARIRNQHNLRRNPEEGGLNPNSEEGQFKYKSANLLKNLRRFSIAFYSILEQCRQIILEQTETCSKSRYKLQVFIHIILQLFNDFFSTPTYDFSIIIYILISNVYLEISNHFLLRQVLGKYQHLLPSPQTSRPLLHENFANGIRYQFRYEQ
ncbi:UNKNOWN [Stylonychia lemnae]|uniref:Ion transport domain-containing protein n=1 Tax=Stylonychia lemnae TaxID=5949 RepID=A0A078B8K2_STYLE|nr:UNKNOWN [Stylonychia lemnae]|eukprot:CDW90739.1 UNKNOWN [Stylonychia lemnae]